eukprot:5660674-Alexandrium_andersonii.AAC.1
MFPPTIAQHGLHCSLDVRRRKTAGEETNTRTHTHTLTHAQAVARDDAQKGPARRLRQATSSDRLQAIGTQNTQTLLRGTSALVQRLVSNDD